MSERYTNLAAHLYRICRRLAVSRDADNSKLSQVIASTFNIPSPDDEAFFLVVSEINHQFRALKESINTAFPEGNKRKAVKGTIDRASNLFLISNANKSWAESKKGFLNDADMARFELADGYFEKVAPFTIMTEEDAAVAERSLDQIEEVIADYSESVHVFLRRSLAYARLLLKYRDIVGGQVVSSGLAEVVGGTVMVVARDPAWKRWVNLRAPFGKLLAIMSVLAMINPAVDGANTLYDAVDRHLLQHLTGGSDAEPPADEVRTPDAKAQEDEDSPDDIQT